MNSLLIVFITCEGDCNSNEDCEGSLKCGTNNCQGPFFAEENDCCSDKCDGGDSCCSEEYPCGEGEGDCDSDSECRDGFLCGSDNCKKGSTFDDGDDCCVPICTPGSDGKDGSCLSACSTTGGTAGGLECKFPFEYSGENPQRTFFFKDDLTLQVSPTTPAHLWTTTTRTGATLKVGGAIVAPLAEVRT